MKASRAHWLLGLCVVAGAVAGPKSGERLSFVSCPIVRDTSTVPCWLAEYEGEVYFLTLQTDVSAPVTPPWLGHRVLVQGVVSDEPRICGGRVLAPVTLSVLAELDASCNTLLPAEERFDLTFEPPRPPGPSRGRLAFGDPAARDAAAPAQPVFTLQYEFDGLVVFRHAQILQRIFDSARAAPAGEVRITAYRSGSRLSNGTVMRERPGIERERARQLRDLLSGAGLVDVKYTLQWKDLSKRPDGTADGFNRRAEVELVSKPAAGAEAR
jgi:hypothetical protein